MKYHCGHEGCDICGARNCRGNEKLEKITHGQAVYCVCRSCLSWSVKFVYDAACHLGGTVIDPAKACDNKEHS